MPISTTLLIQSASALKASGRGSRIGGNRSGTPGSAIGFGSVTLNGSGPSTAKYKDLLIRRSASLQPKGSAPARADTE